MKRKEKEELKRLVKVYKDVLYKKGKSQEVFDHNYDKGLALSSAVDSEDDIDFEHDAVSILLKICKVDPEAFKKLSEEVIAVAVQKRKEKEDRK